MASLICAISNEVPESPVVSPVSGQVYERRLIEKFISDNGTDPINREPLTVEELIEIKCSPLVKPKPPSATSIPAILKSLQDEWDAVMLHSFTLRQQLQTARQELSHALYQHDAACRVIARLNKELTAAREALATLKPQTAPVAGYSSEGARAQTQQMETGDGETKEMTGITEQIIEKLTEKANLLTAERKRRGKTVPEGLVSADDIKQYGVKASHPGLHSASVPGLLALDISVKDTNKIVTGGADKNATVFNRETETQVVQLKGHTKKVNRVVYHMREDVVITGSHDNTVRVWNAVTGNCGHVLRVHDGPVTGVSLHATGDYVLTTSSDKHWTFSDINTGQLVSRVTDTNKSAPLTCAQFHPDGLIFGIGSNDNGVQIWDLKESLNVANFNHDGVGQISALAFSENGYYLATAAEDCCVKLWDLRKLRNFKTLPLDEGYEVKDLCFDTSGSYLAVAGSDVRVYLCKQWDTLKVMTEHTAIATGVRFGQNATYLASTSMDRTLKMYSQ